MTAIRDAYSNSSAGTNGDESLYFFVAHSTNDSNYDLLNPNLGGVRWNGNDPRGFDRDDSEWIALFRNGLYTSSVSGRLRLNHDEKVRAVAHKATVHELGHVLNMGENEPAERKQGDEVSSGSSGDPTLERMNDTRSPFFVDEWNVMSGGAERAQYLPPTNETYFAFSSEKNDTSRYKRHTDS